MQSFPRPFDPVTLASSLRNAVCKDSLMKYTAFYRSGIRGGVSTGYSAGCCLRCIFCCVDQSRDDPEKFGRFYSPEEVFEELIKNANIKGVKRLRISGGEPTICREHLLRVIDLIQNKDAIMTLETNGILFGADEGYVENLSIYKQLHIRLSLKAGTPESFERITGSKAEFFELPFHAITYLIKHKLSFHVASMTDPRIMPADEKASLLKRLQNAGYKDFLEEETCEAYPDTTRRLKEDGLNIFAEEWIA